MKSTDLSLYDSDTNNLKKLAKLDEFLLTFLKVMTSTSESLTSKGANRVFPCKISTDVGIAGT